MLNGRVIDVVGDAVAGATVFVRGAASVVTDADGCFTVASRSSRQLRMFAHKMNMCSARVAVMSYDGRRPLVLKLFPGSTVVVRVNDDIRPVSNAIVNIDNERSCTTNSGGIAIFEGVDPDLHRLSAIRGRSQGTSLVRITNRGECRIECIVTMKPGVFVSGAVLTADGEGVPGASVVIVGERNVAHGISNRDGTWNVGPIQAARYEIFAKDDRCGSSDIVVVPADGELADRTLVLRLKNPTSVAGQVLGEDEIPIPFAKISFIPVSVRSRELVCESDVNGRFCYSDPDVRSFRVFASDSMRSSNTTVLPATLAGTIALTLRMKESMLRGIVTDTRGAPVEGGVVTVESPLRIDTTDALGSFVLGAVPPGIYRARVRRTPGKETWAVEDIATNQENRLVVKGAGGVRGVVSSGDSAMRSFGIVLAKEGRPPREHDAVWMCNDDGSFCIDDLYPGRWMLYVYAPGVNANCVAGIEVHEYAITDLGKIVLGPASRIRGFVRDGTGGVSGATVTIGRQWEDEFAATQTLTPWFAGPIRTVTDAGGRFVFEDIGLSLLVGGCAIFATHPSAGTSWPIAFSGEDEELILNLSSTGSIDGSLAGFLHGECPVVVVARSVNDVRIVRTSRVDAAGGFCFDRMLPGAYVVLAPTPPGGRTAGPASVIVRAGDISTIRLTAVEGPNLKRGT